MLCTFASCYQRQLTYFNIIMITDTLLGAVIIINELMASNIGTAMSPATNFDSWIELYNPTEQPIDLAGMYLSDDANNLTRWHLPHDMGSIPAKGYKVVWLGSNNIKTTQAPFKLDCEGGAIYLSDTQGQLITSVEYPEALSRSAWARTTDGGDEWGWTADATPGESNATSVFCEQRLDPPIVSQDSRLFRSSLTIDVSIPEGATLAYTTDGSVPTRPTTPDIGKEWTETVVNGDCEGDDVTCLVGKDGDEGGAYNTKIVEGAGYAGSRGIKVHSVARPAEDWSTQFFVYTPDHVWHAGDRYRFRMKVRATHTAHISAQSHTTPGSYIHWAMLDGGYNVTPQWQEIVYEGEVSDQQAGWNGLQTIAFNLNELRGTDNDYYFDDISWESYTGSGSASTKVSQDGHFVVGSTTNYCFRLFKEGCLPSVPVTRSYIKTSNEYTLPVVSIVGDPRYFTDPQWGIDTQGTNGRTGNGQSTKCNYNMDWERPVNFSYITPDGVMAYNQDVQISVSGGWTRAANPRSFKLKSGKEFDGQNRLDYVFFPQKPYLRNKVLLLRNGGNDVWENGGSRFLDPALQTIVQRSGINLDLQSYVPVIEYVNGEFRGVLNLREPNNKKFADSNFGYNDDLIDMFEMSADSNVVFMVGDDVVLNRIYQLGEHASEPESYEELKQLLDIDEYINYMAVELFLGSTDWPHNNIKGYRDREDGRYRFILFDLDFAFKNTDPFAAFADDQWHTFNLIFDTNEQRYEEIKLVTFFLNLLKNDEFRKRFIDTYCLVGGSVFDKDRGTAIVDELANIVRPMMQLDYWRSPDGSADLIKNKLKTLNESMMNCMQRFKPMNLSGTAKQSVRLNVDARGALLYVNGIEVPYSQFKGRLFAPVQLEAKAPAGYAFAGWRDDNSTQGGYLSTSPSIALPEGTVALTACFIPLSESVCKAEGITPIRINEVSAANGIYVNEYWKRNDWIELYNTTNQPIDVEGMYLTDNLNKPHKYQISKDDTQTTTTIAPHGRLIVWCDKLQPVSQLHADFKLDAAGGDLMLTAADDSWSDILSYDSHEADQTVGRYPDGTNDVYLMNVPSIAKPNIRSSYMTAVMQPHQTGINEMAASDASTLRARYAAGRLTVRGCEPGSVRAEVYNLAGQPVCSVSALTHHGYGEMSVDHLEKGSYIARITDDRGHTAVCRFLRR